MVIQCKSFTGPTIEEITTLINSFLEDACHNFNITIQATQQLISNDGISVIIFFAINTTSGLNNKNTLDEWKVE